MINKKEKFKNAYIKYKQGVISDLEYLQIFYSVIKQGDGLVWKDIEEIINEYNNMI